MNSFNQSMVGFDFTGMHAWLLPQDRDALDAMMGDGADVEAIAVFMNEASKRRVEAESGSASASEP